jgi:hypothetical protein
MHTTVSRYQAQTSLQLRRRQPSLVTRPVYESAGSTDWQVRLRTVVIALIDAALCMVAADAVASHVDADSRGR